MEIITSSNAIRYIRDTQSGRLPVNSVFYILSSVHHGMSVNRSSISSPLDGVYLTVNHVRQDV